MEAMFGSYRLLRRLERTRAEPPGAQACGGDMVAITSPAAGTEEGGDAPGDALGVRHWCARDSHDDRLVALKIFPAAWRARAEREADLVRLVDHPHLLRLDGIEEDGGAVALVFPWAAQGSLADLLATRRRLTWAETLTVLIPVADALAAAHERGVVHGDLSPANVLIEDHGRPVLADFGAARVASECGGTIAFTAAHVAPETVRGAAPRPAADVFALGSVALCCLAGRPAWQAEDFDEVMIATAVGTWPELDPGLAPAALAELVAAMLAPEPEERPTAAALAVRLRGVGRPSPLQLTGHRPGSAPAAATVVRPDALRPPVPPKGFRRTRRWWPGRRTLVGVVAGSVALAVLAGGGWLVAAGPAAPAALGAPVADGDTVAAPSSVASGPSPDSAPDSAAAGSAGSASTGGAIGAVNWDAVVNSLDEIRSRALAAKDATLLDLVYTYDAQARRGDEEAIDRLTRSGWTVDGLRHEFDDVTVIGDGGGPTVTVRAVARLAERPLRDAAGARVGSARAVPAAPVTIRLRKVGDGYRISSLAARTGSASVTPSGTGG